MYNRRVGKVNAYSLKITIHTSFLESRWNPIFQRSHICNRFPNKYGWQSGRRNGRTPWNKNRDQEKNKSKTAKKQEQKENARKQESKQARKQESKKANEQASLFFVTMVSIMFIFYILSFLSNIITYLSY